MERACGLDVHKVSVFSCIINENGEIISEKFGVLTPDLEELRRHLVENRVDAPAMESTSIYWMPVWQMRKYNRMACGCRFGSTARRGKFYFYIPAGTHPRQGGALTKHVRTTLIM